MKLNAFISLLCTFSALQAKPGDISLVNNKKSNYVIVIQDNASYWDSLAAKELQHYLHEISGVKIPIAGDNSPAVETEIVIGQNRHSRGLNLSSIKSEEGFIIKTSGRKLYVAGGKHKGSLNGVYSFLEKYLGCRMYSPKAKIIPKKSSIILPKISLSENPVFTYRDVHYSEEREDEYCRWHKLSDSQDRKIWGLFVHTFQTLLPPEKYFREHPEYFALRNGIRVPEEPCLSNPEVLRIMTQELRRRMEENPSAAVWSVSQNDNYSFCQCPECSRLDSAEGSPSASVISFVNKMARQFPGKIISTLAYQYSRKAPETIRPEKNVNIMLCTIECYRTNPLETDTSAASFTHDIIEWSKLTDNIMVWDYVVQFTNLLSPFPNFHVLKPNIQFFAKHGAKMMFQQGAGPDRPGSEFEELRSYMIAKLLWNPGLNADSVMNDFLAGYYGSAGKYIRKYIDLMKNELIKSGAKLWIYASPVESIKDYLAPRLMTKYNSIFDEAEKAVRNKPEFLSRVKAARLPLEYATLEQAKVKGIGKDGLFIKKNDGKYIVNPAILSLLENFPKGCKEAGSIYIHEKNLTVEDYINRYKNMLSKSMKNPLGLFKPVKYITSPSDKYSANGMLTLTDGMRGDEDHHFNWQGFEGEDMEVVLDLEKTETVQKVSMDFLQMVYSWIFLPEDLELSISDDGMNFRKISTVKNDNVIDSTETLRADKSDIFDFSFRFEPVKARYLKIKARSLKTCPRWHTGYPGKAWLFTDEIVVE